MSQQEWEQRALTAEASLQALRDKVVPLVNKTKELEKEAKKWKSMCEGLDKAVDSPVSVIGSGTIRKNPSQAKKYVLEDGSELSSDQVIKLTQAATDGKLEADVLRLQNTYLLSLLKKVSVSQYVAKDIIDQHPDDWKTAAGALARFVDTVTEEVELAVAAAEGKKPESERVERITVLKVENNKLADGFEAEQADKQRYKKELRATKKIAKTALQRVAEVESELKEEKAKWKKEATDYKVEIHTLKNQLAAAATSESSDRPSLVASDVSDASKPRGSVIRRPATAAGGEEEGGTRAASGTVTSANQHAMSGIAQLDENKEIEGGVGQKVVQMKEKKAAAYAKDGKAGRYDTMRNLDGEVVKTETGLTVINTNKKVEKMVSHEMNVAKIQVMEGRNLTPKKASKTGFEMWFKLEMGSAVFQSPAQNVEDPATACAKWGLEYAYVISTGLQSKPTIPISVFYRPLSKSGQSTEGEGKELGQIVIPLTTFLPLIGTSETVSQWMPVTDRESKEVRGILQVILRVDSNVSTSERMLPKEEGFSKSLLRENISNTMVRSAKVMAEAAPVAEIVDLDPLQQRVSAADPKVEHLVKELDVGKLSDPAWKSFRKQNWIHLAAMCGNASVVRQLVEANAGDVKVVDATDKAGFSPFMYAVIGGHVVVAQYLRGIKGVNVNRADWNGNTPLHLAGMWGHSRAVIDFLVHDCQCSVDTQDENGATALHHAAFNGHKETVAALCNLQAMVNAEDRDGSSPLLLALMQNHSDVARYLKDDKKADIGSFNSRGDTCLWATIQNHNDELMNVLLKDQRTDLSRKLGFFDFTLLMRCLLQLDYALCDKIVGIILSQKPDVNITNKLGMTALYYAVAMNRPNMVTFLTMACGALVRVKDKSGNTPLHFCGNENIARTLISHGAGQQVNLPNAQGNTPLHAAFAFGGPAVADVLLSAGGDMTRKNNDGLTPADCVLVDTKYITLPFYEEDSHYEHTIFIGSKLKK